MAKEKSTTELKAERLQLATRSKEITDGARGEQRMLNEGENKELGEIQCRLVDINVELAAKETENRQKGSPHTQPGQEKFSLRRAILAHMNHQEQRESEAGVIEEAARLHRSIAATSEGCGDLIIPMESRASYTAATEAATGIVIDEEKRELLLPLESSLVLAQAGVKMLTGLVGNITWPKHGAAKVFWEGENSEAKDGSGAFSKNTVYSPKRLTAYVDISKQLLVQENMSVEGLIRQLIAVAIAQKLEQTAFGTHAHDDNTPDGLFQKVPATKGAMTWANIVEMETKADLSNALFGNLAYIMHPSLVGKAKTLVKDASGAGGFIIGQDGKGMLNGYNSFRTNNIPTGLQTAKDESGIIFANWADYFLGQWGALDMTVDPYTQATKGVVRLVVNSYWNMGMIREESFAIASMK